MKKRAKPPRKLTRLDWLRIEKSNRKLFEAAIGITTALHDTAKQFNEQFLAALSMIQQSRMENALVNMEAHTLENRVSNLVEPMLSLERSLRNMARSDTERRLAEVASGRNA